MSNLAVSPNGILPFEQKHYNGSVLRCDLGRWHYRVDRQNFESASVVASAADASDGYYVNDLTPRIFVFALLVLACMCVGDSSAEDFGYVPPKVQAMYYADTRGFNSGTLWVIDAVAPLKLNITGFTDYLGNPTVHDRAEVTRTFSEYRVSHAFPGDLLDVVGLSVQVEANAFSGDDNDLLRCGFQYQRQVSIPQIGVLGGGRGFFKWRIHPFETDGDGWQTSILYSFPVHSRVKVTGFADYNVRDGKSNEWVVEPQVNVKVSDRVWALAEYRYNGFGRKAVDVEHTGWAIGVGVDFF